jgi:NAD(P)-dependent dehydrogenase (short-subunit alcohol dehydrogenase family)
MMETKKIALVTGSNKGIGLEVVKQLSEKDYKVILTSRDAAKGTKAVEELNQQGYGNISFLQLDITDVNSIENAIQELTAQNLILDVLVNNAGISGPWPQSALTISMQDVKTVFETNVFGVLHITQRLLPFMRNASEPRIVNVSSSLGSSLKNADPMWKYGGEKLAAYNASKTALNSLTITLAFELKNTKFKINSVNPGYTATDLNGFRGELHPTDAAKVIVKYATLDQDGPTGGFFEAEGMLPW